MSLLKEKLILFKQLPSGQKSGLILIAFLLLVLPLVIIASLNPTQTTPRAQAGAEVCQIKNLACQEQYANMKYLSWEADYAYEARQIVVKMGGTYIYLSGTDSRSITIANPSSNTFEVGCAVIGSSSTREYGFATVTCGATETCPVGWPNNRIFYGDVLINGANAPVGSKIRMYSPRNELVGCQTVKSPSDNPADTRGGIMGYTYVYGNTPGQFAGMYNGEPITFKIEGYVAQTEPSPVIWGSAGSTYVKLSVTIQNLTPTSAPTSTPTPAPAQPTPTPTSLPPLPSPTPSACTSFGTSVLDQYRTETYTKTQVGSTTWTPGSALTFSPNQKGKLDKTELFVSGNGAIESKIIDSSGNLTEVVSKAVNSAAGSWVSFDFQTEPLIDPNNTYTVGFRGASGTIYVHRGSSWNWARKIYLKPCQ